MEETNDDSGEEPDFDDEYEAFLRFQRATFEHVLPDGILGVYVDVVENSKDTSFGITLTVEGNVISGRLVSSVEYMRTLADHIDDAVGPETGQAVTTALRFVADMGDERRLFDRLSDEPEFSPDEPSTQLEALRQAPRSIVPIYIHLLDAVILEGGKPLPLPGWRGRLASVTGWGFGQFAG